MVVNVVRKCQRGFALIELSIAIILATILATLASNKFINDFEEDLARATGAYFFQLNNMLQDYMVTYVLELSNNQYITSIPGDYLDGTVNGTNRVDPPATLTPDLPRLKTLRKAPGAFPEQTPLKQPFQIQLTVGAACPGAGCQIQALAYTTAPIVRGGQDRNNLALIARLTSGGFGVASTILDPTRLMGANCNVPNPVAGTPVGILGSCSTINAGLYSLFVRRNDDRDPDLQGDLTVAGNIRSRLGNITASTGVFNAPAGDFNAGSGVNAGVPCSRAQMTRNGNFVGNTAACVAQMTLGQDATNGGFLSLMNLTGTEKIRINAQTSTIQAGVAGTRVLIQGDAGTVDASNSVLAGSLVRSGNANGVSLTSAGLITAGGPAGTAPFEANGASGNLDLRGAGGRFAFNSAGGNLSVNDSTNTNKLVITNSSGDLSSQGELSAVNRVRSDSRVEVLNAGTVRTQMTNTGEVRAKNTAGTTDTVLMDGQNALIRVSDTGANRILLNGATGLASAEGIQSTQSATLGSGCATQGEIRQRTGVPGSYVNCAGGQWTAFGPRRVSDVSGNGLCGSAATFSVIGELGVGPNGESVICKQKLGNGYWVQQRYLFSDFVFLASTLVVDEQAVPKPSCAQVGGVIGTPLIFLIAQNEASPDIAFNRYAVDEGAQWRVKLKSGNNTSSLVAGSALAQQYCFYSSNS